MTKQFTFALICLAALGTGAVIVCRTPHTSATHVTPKLAEGIAIDTLIDELPSETAFGGPNPSQMTIFHEWSGSKPNSPAHQLVAFGVKAAPRLIAKLSDTRDTMCREPGLSGRSFRSVGDVSIQILDEIAGKRFASSPVSVDPDKVDLLKSDIKEWFKAHPHAGDLKDLTLELESSHDGQAVESLTHRYPKQASQVISDVLHRRLVDTDSYTLIWHLTDVRDQIAVSALRFEAQSGLDAKSRISAVKWLCGIDPAFASAVLIKEWQHFKDPDPRTTDENDLTRDVFIDPCFALGRLDVLERLSSNFKKRPAEFREHVLATAINRGFANFSDPARQALERLLVEELDDKSPAVSGFNRMDRYPNIGVADRAALALSKCFPDKYHFQYSSVEADMTRQREEFRSIWRSTLRK